MDEQNRSLFFSICGYAALFIAAESVFLLTTAATAPSEISAFPPAPVFIDRRRGLKVFEPRNTFLRKDYKDNHWWRMIENRDHHNTRTIDGRDFRNEFRIPATFFDSIVTWYRENGWESEKRDAFYRQPVPLELKILSSFQILGRGVPPAVPAKLIGCDQGTIRRFFNQFIFNVATNMNSLWIKFPKTSAEVKSCVETYAREHLPGCMGSIDCVHVPWPKAIASLRSWYVGKEGIPTVAFEVIVDHSRRILSVSQPHPGSLNDKTVASMDCTLHEVRTLPLYTTFPWKALEAPSSEKSMHGVYLICDGGYHLWRIMQRCSVVTSNPRMMALMNKIASARKDVECTFGILKSRFRCLKVPILMAELSDVKNLFLTCCIFHNMLLDHDGGAFDGRLNASDFGSSRYNISTNTDFSGTSPPPAGYYLGSSAEATHVQLRTILANHLHFIHQQNRPCNVSPSSPLSNLVPGTTVTTPPTVSRL
jgi:hypothetical protein